MFLLIVIGGHRNNPTPSHQFVFPTPNEGAVISAVYYPFNGGLFGADFQVQANIYSPTVRYRQYIKGTFKYDGVDQVHQLNGGNLHPTNFIEDGNANGVYGVRGQNIHGLSIYQPGPVVNNIQSYIFRASDTPSDNLTCPSGTRVEIDLTFKGVICDPNPSNFVYVTRYWHVRGIFTKP